MKEVLEDCLKAARERYSGAQRFAFLIAALFLAVRLTTVTQYLRRGPALRKANKDAETAKSLSELSRQIVDSTGKLAKEQADQTKAIIDSFVNGLEADFRELDVAIERARGGPPRENQPQQQQVRAPILTLPKDLSEKVKLAPDFDAIKQLVAPWIEEHLVQARLDQLKDAWKTKVWSKLTDIGGDLISHVDEALKLAPEDPDLKELGAKVKALVQSGASLNFVLPTDHSRWRTRQAKVQPASISMQVSPVLSG
jgi:hypothetical protein